jgi:hypothetical protein
VALTRSGDGAQQWSAVRHCSKWGKGKVARGWDGMDVACGLEGERRRRGRAQRGAIVRRVTKWLTDGAHGKEFLEFS